MCDMNDLMEIIKSRKSIRTFDGSTLSDMHRQILEDHMKDIPNPFGIPAEFVLLDAKEHAGIKVPTDTEYIVSVMAKED